MPGPLEVQLSICICLKPSVKTVKRRHSMASKETTGLVTVDNESPKSEAQMAREARMVFETFKKEVLNDPINISASRNNPIVVEGIDNYYLLCDDRPVSVTELPLSIGGVAVRLSENSRPIHLLGQTRSGVGIIKLRAEMWKLWALGRNFGPRISIRTPNGWTRLYNPRPVYRKIMNDGLTLVHLLHCIERNPTASAVKIKKYLEEEFRKREERPSMHKLHSFYSAVKRYLLKESEEKRNGILSDLFPEQFYLESFAPEIDLDRSTTVFSVLDESHEGLEESHEEIRSSEFRQQDMESGDDSTPNPPNIIAGNKSTIEMLREINRSDKGDNKSLKDEIYDLPPRSTQLLPPYMPSLRSSEAANETLEGAERLQRQKHKEDIMEQYAVLIQEGPEQDALSDCKPTKKRREQPIENKIEGNPFKPDRNSKLDDPPICIICDDGGDLLCCEGPCQRYFHGVEGVTGRESYCETLGLTRREVKEKTKFHCKNCQFQKHQCFICGELGSSAASPALGHQEALLLPCNEPTLRVQRKCGSCFIFLLFRLHLVQVLLCRASACRRYYHPECVARALITTSDWKTLAEKIQRGQQGFHCPRHCCRVCQTEELNPGDLVQCRRCPKAWHLDCLQDYDFSNESPETQVWKHYKRQFIFCKDHKILPMLQTPVRDHIRFPK